MTFEEIWKRADDTIKTGREDIKLTEGYHPFFIKQCMELAWKAGQKEAAKRCIVLIQDSVENMSFEELLHVIQKEFLDES